MGNFAFFLLMFLQKTLAELYVIVPPSTDALFGSSAVLPCTYRINYPSFNSQFIAIFWHFGYKELLRYDNKGTVASPRVTIDEKAVMDGNVSLTLHNVTLSDEGMYSCLVIYSQNKKTEHIKLNVQARPVVKMRKKIPTNTYDTELQCSVTGFYPAQIKVTWLRNGQPLFKGSLSTPQINADNTFRVNSTVSLTSSETKDNPMIVCQVEHESLQSPAQDGFNVVQGDIPSVQMFSTEAQQGMDQIFVCEMTGLDPRLVKVNWLQNGQSIDTDKSNADGSLKTNIYYSLRPTGKGDLESVSCEVQHESLYSPIIETLHLREDGDVEESSGPNLAAAIILTMLFTTAAVCAVLYYLFFKKKYFQRFRVSPICKPVMLNDDKLVTLYCAASDCVKHVKVTWTVTEVDGNKITVSDSQSLKDEEHGPLLSKDYTVRTDQSKAGELHNVITTLRFIHNVSKHNNMKVVCKFDCDGKSKEEKFTFQDIKKPKKSEPIKLSLGDLGEPLCSMSLQKFYPKEIQITWSCGVGHYQEMETFRERFSSNPDQTFNVESACRIPEHLFNEPGFKVRVTWMHNAMENPEHMEFSTRDPDFPWLPVMGEIRNPSPCLHNTEAKLQCKISNYFPKALEVKWLKRGAGNKDLFSVTPSDKYRIPVIDVSRDTNNSFTCTASLIVTVSVKEELGAEYICKVEHPSLERPLERSTGPLNVIGVPVVKNISYLDKSITLEVESFFPPNIVIIWSRAESKPKDYKQIPDSGVQNYIHASGDGSFRLTSICEPFDMLYKVNSIDLYIKVVIQHNALKCPIEMIFLRHKGDFYFTSEGLKQGIILKMHKQNTQNIPASNIPRLLDYNQTDVSHESHTPADQSTLKASDGEHNLQPSDGDNIHQETVLPPESHTPAKLSTLNTSDGEHKPQPSDVDNIHQETGKESKLQEVQEKGPPAKEYKEEVKKEKKSKNLFKSSKK